jgi:hypothetical protein
VNHKYLRVAPDSILSKHDPFLADVLRDGSLVLDSSGFAGYPEDIFARTPTASVSARACHRISAEFMRRLPRPVVLAEEWRKL